METVGSALGDDVDDATHSPSKFRAVAAVDDAKLLDSLLRRGGFLNSRSGGHIVSTVNRHEVVMDVLPRKRKLGYRLNDHVCAARGCVANGHAGREQCEIDELASIYREILDFLLINH